VPENYFLASLPAAIAKYEVKYGRVAAGVIQAKMASNKCVSKKHIDKCGGQLKLCASPVHPAPFSRATTPSLIVCLYLAYSKLLTIKINGGVECRFV